MPQQFLAIKILKLALKFRFKPAKKSRADRLRQNTQLLTATVLFTCVEKMFLLFCLVHSTLCNWLVTWHQSATSNLRFRQSWPRDVVELEVSLLSRAIAPRATCWFTA